MPNHILPRPELERVPLVVHGGFDSTRAPADLLDFSANVNPFGPSPRIWDAIRSVDVARHPDPRAAPLRSFLAEIERLDVRQVLAGNGSTELIYHLANAYLRAGDHVLIVEPTFGEYAAAAALAGAQVVAWRARPDEQFRLDIDELLALAQQLDPRMIFLCNPNNPTGIFLDRVQVARLLSGCPGALLVLDESFINFVADAWSARDLLGSGNLVVLRSLTKDYALTGLRVGYALASPDVIAALLKVQPPWSVNALAQAAALAALQDQAHLRDSLAALACAKNCLVQQLAQLGPAPLPSHVHFFLLPVRAAAGCARRLLERRILVRDCSSFGLPTFVRIAARLPEENEQLVAALAEISDER
ncbi:MAG: pyridoxal phosphate-dependent aminotransferase [Roseiflexaceae bacterium]